MIKKFIVNVYNSYKVYKHNRLKYLLLKSLIIALSLGLSACGPKYADHKFRAKQFETGGKSVVLVKAFHRNRRCFMNIDIPVNYSFAKIDQNYPRTKLRHAYYVKNQGKFFSSWYDFWGDRYTVLMLDPGIYVVEKISYSNASAEIYSTSDGLNPGKENFVYGGFEVKPGEVIYLGDINFALPNITVTDNIDKAKLFLSKKYPELDHRILQKRLLDLNGSLSQYYSGTQSHHEGESVDQ